MQGLLDWIKTPEGQGLLAGAFGGLAGARRGAPMNSIGHAGMSGLLGYANANEQQSRSGDHAFKVLQQQRMQKDWANEDAIKALAPQFMTAGQPAVPAYSGSADIQSALPDDLQIPSFPATPARPAQPAKFDKTGYANALMGIDPLKGEAYQQSISKENPFNKLDAKDFTADSIKIFLASGGRDQSLLQTRTISEVAPNGMAYDPYSVKAGTIFADPNKPFSTNQQGGFTPNLPYQSYEIGKAKAGSAHTAVNVNTDKSYFSNVAEGLAKNDVTLIDAARSAPDRIASSKRVREVLLQNPITGTGAEMRLSLNKALVTAGLVDGKTVADTETLASTLASQTLDAIKTSGLGSGQGFTDKDRAFLERAKSGSIEMNAESLRRIADLNERQARSTIQRGNAIITKLRGSTQAGAMGQQLDIVQEPEAFTGKESTISGGGWSATLKK